MKTHFRVASRWVPTAIALSLLALACYTTGNTGPQQSAVARPRIKFMWHGIGGTSCNTPLGICIEIPIGLSDSSELTAEEVAQGFGFAQFQIVNGKLIITPEREAALPDGTVVFDHAKRLEPDLAKALGYFGITMNAGVYRVDRAYGKYGRITVDVLLEK